MAFQSISSTLQSQHISRKLHHSKSPAVNVLVKFPDALHYPAKQIANQFTSSHGTLSCRRVGDEGRMIIKAKKNRVSMGWEQRIGIVVNKSRGAFHVCTRSVLIIHYPYRRTNETENLKVNWINSMHVQKILTSRKWYAHFWSDVRLLLL